MSEAELLTTKRSTNGRQIPEAIFLDDVQGWIGGGGVDPELGLQKLQQTLGKYQLMQSSSTQRRTSLELKIPELERTIAMVEQLRGDLEADQDRVATFELCDTLYATANISNQENVYIWLGANTMLSYPLDQAEALLTNKLTTATTNLLNVKEDLSWLRDQITVTEVNIARVYNFDVKRRRIAREQQQS